jgi:hypothetical protein
MKMCSKETKNKKDETAFSNCFKMCSEMMSRCFKDEGKFDCSAIMEAMKNQSCCNPKGEDIKTGCCDI